MLCYVYYVKGLSHPLFVCPGLVIVPSVYVCLYMCVCLRVCLCVCLCACVCLTNSKINYNYQFMATLDRRGQEIHDDKGGVRDTNVIIIMIKLNSIAIYQQLRFSLPF